MKKLRLIIPIVAILLFALPLFPAQAAPQAAATAASIEVSSGSFLVGSPVSIRVYDVAASGASFTVYFTYDSSGTDTLEVKTEYANLTVQLGTGSDEWTYTMIFEAPTAGSSITVHVTGTATGTTTDLCAQQIMAQDPEDLLPTDMVITVGIALMIILIVVSIVMGLSKRKRR